MFERPGQRLRLGNYEPLLELASGGMATVYIARQIGAAGFERIVVVKRVHRHLLGNREFYTMFVDEAHLASLIHHSNVVSVIDVVEWEGELFLVMEYVESSSLSTLLRAASAAGQRLPAGVAVRVVADALYGLHAAHEVVDMRGNHLEVVHRDVSPQNVIVAVDGCSRLIDFGVAKARHRLTETKSGSLKGKYGYMAPEQARGLGLDRRADLFALGTVLHESLTGQPLFRGDSELDCIRRLVEEPIPDPSIVVPGLPRALDEVVQKALARDRDVRFQTAAEFVEALEGALSPAPAREVAACLEKHCGKRLAKRRAALQAILDGRVAPLSVSPSGRDLTREGSEERTKPSTPSAQGARPGPSGTDSQIAATRDPFSEARDKRRRLLLGVAIGAVAVAAAAVLLRVALPGRDARIAPPTSAPAAAASPVAGERGEDAGAGIEIVLLADEPIDSVGASGTRLVQIAGTRARLLVAPWSGTLSIEGRAGGGKPVRASARADGPREIRLERIPPGPSASVASAAPPPGSTSKPGTKRPPASSTATSTSTAELHGNPYDNP